MAIPTLILTMWLMGLLSVAVIAGGIHLIRLWYLQSLQNDSGRYVFDPDFGYNNPTLFLVLGVYLLLWAAAGGRLVRLYYQVKQKLSKGKDIPREERTGKKHRLKRPDGSEIEVEMYGPENGIPIVLTHGWGYNSTQWYYLKHQLSERFRLILWDLPGLGLSKGPDNHDYSLEKFAADLKAVLSLAGNRPALLLGHSIGGMITLTFCKQFFEMLRSQVSGLALVHTTYTNPVRTTKNAAFYTTLEKPVIKPLLYLTIWLSPLVRLMNWLGYRNGTTHISVKRSGFVGLESWEQLDFIAKLQSHGSPSIVARGMLGMLRYDATGILRGIRVPTLVVPGDRDPTCLPQASEFIGKSVEGARLKALDFSKHVGFIEHNRTFAEMIGEFATSCSVVEETASDVLRRPVRELIRDSGTQSLS